MRFFDFFKARNSNLLSEPMTDFYDLLTKGNEVEIGERIYQRDLLSNDAVLACVNGVTYHCRAPNPNGRLMEKGREVSSNGQFLLLILTASWAPDKEDDLIPLIVTTGKKGVEIAGIVLPFDDLMPKLKGDVCSQIGELSAKWIVRKIRANSMSS